MTTCVEGDLEITFPNAWSVRKFDGLAHQFSEMKAVDFIAESSDLIAFIEVKDPNHPRISQRDRKNIVNDYKSEKKDFELKYKFRDSFLYEWAWWSGSQAHSLLGSHCRGQLWDNRIG